MRKQSLAILSLAYPMPNEPSYTFLEQLVNEFVKLGTTCTVIVPTCHIKRILKRLPRAPYREVRNVSGGAVTILRPEFLSIGKSRMTVSSFKRAAKRAILSLPEKPDALYSHFLFPAGLAASEISKETGIPAFLAFGESDPSLFSFIDKGYMRDRVSDLQGIVCVSEANRQMFIDEGLLADPAKAHVFPNGVDTSVFRPMSRKDARKKLGIPQDAFVVGFVGSFIERKGVRVLCDAIDMVESASGLFIGYGEEQKPSCKNIAFEGRLDHKEIPSVLCAADIFALPTLAEGCCNAIIEAMACGLPVVSADAPFNDGLLDETNSIRIDPKDAAAIARAISLLQKDDALRQRLAEGALLKAQSLAIENRAEAILRFMR